MSTTSQPVGTRTSLTSTSLGTLAAANYCVSSAYDASATDPIDLVVEVEVTSTNVPSGNKQAVVFAKASLDNSNYQSGPETGTTTTSEAELTLLGVVPIPTTSQQARRSFSVAAAFGYMPPYLKVIVKNDLGVALTSGAIYTAEVTSTTA